MKLKMNFTAFFLAILMAFSYVPLDILAAEDKLPELSVSVAAKKAIDNNNSIKNAVDNSSLSDENLRKAYDSLYSAKTNDAILNAEVNIMTQEMSRALSIENIQSQKENVEYNITKYFNSIINAEKKLDLFESSLAIEKKKLEIAKIKLEIGKLSQADFDNQQASYNKNLKSKQTYQSSIDKAYRALNNDMGEKAESRYTLLLDLEYKLVGDVNITSYTDKFVKESLTVKQAENNLKTAEFKVDNYSDSYDSQTGVISDPYNAYEQLVVSFNQASRSLADTKSNVKENIISTYDSLKESESSIETEEAAIKTLYKEYEILKLKFEMGKATQLELDEKLYSIKNQEESLRQAKNSHSLTRISFSSPNLLLGGGN